MHVCFASKTTFYMIEYPGLSFSCTSILMIMLPPYALNTPLFLIIPKIVESLSSMLGSFKEYNIFTSQLYWDILEQEKKRYKAWLFTEWLTIISCLHPMEWLQWAMLFRVALNPFILNFSLSSKEWVALFSWYINLLL